MIPLPRIYILYRPWQTSLFETINPSKLVSNADGSYL